MTTMARQLPPRLLGGDARRRVLRHRRLARAVLLACLFALPGALLADNPADTPADANAPPAPPTPREVKKPASNLDYWLGEAQNADANAPPPAAPTPGERDTPRQDALPGALQTSDGRILPGRLYTTRDAPWQVWVESEKRWLRVPFIAVLSITATVVEEKMEPRWRWKEMGAMERVYTGESYPTRRLQWTFRLIDGSEITGEVKGQPVWVELDGRRSGPFVLHERMKGEIGQTLQDLVHVQRIVVSRRLLDRLRSPAAPGR